MPYLKNSKNKHTCNHCYYNQEQGWVCELKGECFMCNICPEHQMKEENKKEVSVW